MNEVFYEVKIWEYPTAVGKSGKVVARIMFAPDRKLDADEYVMRMTAHLEDVAEFNRGNETHPSFYWSVDGAYSIDKAKILEYDDVTAPEDAELREGTLELRDHLRDYRFGDELLS